MALGQSDRTEKPTAKRKGEARKKGQVAKSTDLNGGLVLGGGLLGLTMVAPAVVSSAGDAMRHILAMTATPGVATSAVGLKALMKTVIDVMLATVVPVGLICLAVGVLSNVAQVGFKPSFGAVRPDFKKVNPISGAKNLFGPRAVFETGKSLAKVGLVGAVAASALLP